MNLLAIKETIKKHITIIKETVVEPDDIEAIIAIPKDQRKKD